MGARRKLNWGYLNGSLLLASVAGGLTESWLFFALALLALIAGNVHAGEIRLRRRGTRGKQPGTAQNSNGRREA